MKLSFTQLRQTIRDVNGKPVKIRDNDKSPERDWPLQEAIGEACLADLQDRQAQEEPARLKLEDYDLGKRFLNLKKGEDIKLDAKQVERVGELAVRFYGKRIGGFIKDFLNGDTDGFLSLVGEEEGGSTGAQEEGSSGAANGSGKGSTRRRNS